MKKFFVELIFKFFSIKITLLVLDKTTATRKSKRVRRCYFGIFLQIRKKIERKIYTTYFTYQIFFRNIFFIPVSIKYHQNSSTKIIYDSKTIFSKKILSSLATVHNPVLCVHHGMRWLLTKLLFIHKYWKLPNLWDIKIFKFQKIHTRIIFCVNFTESEFQTKFEKKICLIKIG